MYSNGAKAAEFRTIVGKTCKLVNFLETIYGWCGTAYDLTRPGNIVTVLFGLWVPVVLRKLDTGYRLISTYMQSFMDGEAVNMLERGELKQEEFEIV